MKKLLLSFTMLLIVVTSFSQYVWDLSFDNSTILSKVIIDTINNHNNKWQIGHPTKTMFNSAYSLQKVIVTDTLNSYPPNDTSSFTIIHIAYQGWQGYPKIDIGGWYYVNSDTLTDYGYIEFSSDLGSTWYLISNYTHFCTWGATQELPVFSGNSNGWKHFYYCIQPPSFVNMGDTILYRYTFISDSIQTNKDGLMFDDLHFEDWSEGIEYIQNNNLISIYPNPAHNIITIRRENTNYQQSIQIINCLGEVLFKHDNFIKDFIDVSEFQNGIYFLQYETEREFCVKKIIVNHNL